jgi:hypothetical protein
MIVKLIRDDTWGATLVEFTVTFPFFLLLMFGLLQAGLLLYAQVGLQHGVEMAARCASVNYAAYKLNPPLDTSCFTDPVSLVPTPSTVIADTTNAYIKQYAAKNSWGLGPPASSFTVDPPPPSGGGTCGANVGYVVTAQQQYNLMNYIFSVPLTAESCFPIRG